MEKQKNTFTLVDSMCWRRIYHRQSLKYCRMGFYKPTCGRTVCVPVKNWRWGKNQLQIINSFCFTVVILVRSTGSSRTVILWDSFTHFTALLQHCMYYTLEYSSGFGRLSKLGFQINSFLEVFFLSENKQIEWSSIPWREEKLWSHLSHRLQWPVK